MPHAIHRFACVLALWSGIAGAAHAGVDEPLTLYFRAAITIEADGTLSRLEWDDADRISAPLRARLDARVHGWAFEPGAVQGVPARTESTLRLRLEAEPLGDGMLVRIENAETGPLMRKVAPPSYPRDALRRGHEAEVVAEFHVDGDGAREVVIVGFQGDAGSRKQFETATRAMLADIDVELERVGGHVAPGQFRMPVTFCVDQCPQFERPAADRGDTASTASPGEAEAIASVVRITSDVRGVAL